MTTPAISNESVQNATGKSWEQWFAILENADAANLPHKDIASLLADMADVSPWWAQSITVEYERQIGRREVGQSCEGTYQTAASKTVPGDMDAVLHRWQAFLKDKSEFNGVPPSADPSISHTEKWRYWRIQLADATRVNVCINNKTGNKTQLAVNHEKLPDANAIPVWKEYWKGVLKEFAAGISK